MCIALAADVEEHGITPSALRLYLGHRYRRIEAPHLELAALKPSVQVEHKRCLVTPYPGTPRHLAMDDDDEETRPFMAEMTPSLTSNEQPIKLAPVRNSKID